MVVDGGEVAVLGQADGVELAADGLDPVGLALVVDLLEGTLTVALGIVGGEDAVLAAHDGGHLVAVLIEIADALRLDDGQSRGREEMLDLGQVALQLLPFACLQRSPAVALDAADALALGIVAGEEHVEDVLADDLILYLIHSVLGGLADLHRDDGQHGEDDAYEPEAHRQLRLGDLLHGALPERLSGGTAR